jgi:tRNA pseudouridine synthase D (TruD).
MRDLRGAVDLMIGRPYPGEHEVARAFRSLYDSGDPEGALRAMPRRGYELERRVLSEYLRTGDPRQGPQGISPCRPSFFVEAYPVIPIQPVPLKGPRGGRGITQAKGSGQGLGG